VAHQTAGGCTVEFVGTGDAFASGGRFHACVLVRWAGPPLLIDCGASAPVALQQRRGPLPDVGLVILTHLHGDHFGGVPFLLLDAAYNRRRSTPLTIAGPPGVERRVMDVLELLYPGTRATVSAAVPLEFVELEPGVETRTGQVLVTAVPVKHSTYLPCFGLRITVGNRVLACSGDTEWTPALLDLSRDADLFICECVGFERAAPSHLTHEVLRAEAGGMTARRTVLTHMGEEMLARQADARWTCAHDGLIISV
jgi:ribonuclease BN (tRNA processing enzyme)